MNKKITSLTDQPIRKVNSDLLEAEKYATALSSFILESDTPLTIGIQGEWGTLYYSILFQYQKSIPLILPQRNFAH